MRIVLMGLLLAEIAHGQPRCPRRSVFDGGADWTEISAECPSPIAGILYTRGAHEANGREILGLEGLVVAKMERLEAERAAHKATMADCAVKLDEGSARLEAVSAQLARVADPPSRLVWAGVGAGAVGAVVVGLALWLR